MPARTHNPRPRHAKRRRGIQALIAVALVLGSLILGMSLSSGPSPVAAREPIVVGQFDTVEVPVPIEPVPAGTQVRNIVTRLIAYPKHQLPKGALLDLAPYEDSVVVATLPAALPIFRDNLSLTATRRNPVIEKIPAGMRAMTVKVDATSSVEGWAGSGSVVDALLVTSNRTTVVAENVKILSAERSVSPVEGSSAPSVPSTVTLLVTQEQCLAINTAIPLGKIAFALRNIDDTDSWRSTSFTADGLKGGTSGPHTTVSGYVAIDGGAYALSDGKWVKTEVIPEGFLVGKEDRAGH